MANFLSKFMAKTKVVVEETSSESYPTDPVIVATVYSLDGEVHSTYSTVDEAFQVAGENGLRVEVKTVSAE